jgi:hypothetical protein
MTQIKELKRAARKAGMKVYYSKRSTCVNVYAGNGSFICTSMQNSRKQNVQQCLNFITEV